MTNYYSETCFLIEGWPKEAIDWMIGFAEAVDDNIDGEFDFDSTPESWGRLLERFNYGCIGAVFDRQENGDLLVRSGESVSIDALVDLIQATMAEFKLPGVVAFEWAETASDSVPGAFGGGAAAISAVDFDVVYSGRWLEEATCRLMAGAKDAQGMYVVVNKTRMAYPSPMGKEREHPVMPSEEPHTYGSLADAVEQVVDLHFVYAHTPETAVVYKLFPVHLDDVLPIFEAKKEQLRDDYED